MLNALIKSKDSILTIPSILSAQDALDLLETRQMRCAPVVDESNSMYRGNVYRYHIYQYYYQNPNTDLAQLPVTHFLKNSTRFIHENDSIYQLFFEIRDLPYICVLNKDSRFIGIITHRELMHYLSEAWLANQGSYLIEVKLDDISRDLIRVERIIQRYAQLEHCLSFNKTSQTDYSFVVFALPSTVDYVDLLSLMDELKRRQYHANYFTLN